MAAMRVGGDALTITVDEVSARLLSEFFVGAGGEAKNGPVRSGRVLLMLMGKDKVFLKTEQANASEPVSGALMIERRRIGEILFLGRPTGAPASAIN